MVCQRAKSLFMLEVGPRDQSPQASAGCLKLQEKKEVEAESSARLSGGECWETAHTHRRCGISVFKRQRSIPLSVMQCCLNLTFFPPNLLYHVGGLRAFHTEGAPSAFLI